MITADQLLAHMIGDYILQSDWMATNKARLSVAAAVHAVTYTLPFLLITQAPGVLAVIAATHFVVDRWKIARYIVIAKNLLCPKPVVHSTATGYPEQTPIWLAMWLLIIADNIIHVTINGTAIRWLS